MDLFVDLNCDMGELEDASMEEAIIPHITSANVACGAHAGSDEIMLRTVRLARRYGVVVGAHPGYPDRANFGRIEMAMTAEEIARTVFEQIVRLERTTGASLAHVKPHGALYNVAARRPEVASAIADGVARWNPRAKLVCLAGSSALELWRERGFRVSAEAFADRRYEADGSLRSRQLPDALITDPAAAAGQALRLASSGSIQTICIHSDSPGAIQTVAAVAAALKTWGQTGRFGVFGPPAPGK